MSSSDMPVLAVRRGKTVYPTGNKEFAVVQAFPSAFSEEESDPFLMCDHFGPTISKGLAKHPDEFPVNWHPHRGMDICTYMKQGMVRHADSMGNRETIATPSMQWISVGSGIEHAEGGGTPAGQPEEGFQIWINVPSAAKMADPRYGTVLPGTIPVIRGEGVEASVLAGTHEGSEGPFITVQPLQMVDYTLESSATHVHSVPVEHNNCIIFVYRGSGKINGATIKSDEAIRLDATKSARQVTLQAGPEGLTAILFAGKRLDQKVAWHGPFVMTTDEEIEQTIQEYRQGRFPPKRAPFDYKRIAAFPSK